MSTEPHALTLKQRMVLDYMRGNGCVLSTDGWLHLVRRGSFTNRGLAAVLAALVAKGLVDHTPTAPSPRYKLAYVGELREQS